MKPTKNSLLPYYKKLDLSKWEARRVYVFPGGEEVVIEKPEFLIVSDNGHRVKDQSGRSHYIPYGWIHLWWDNCEGRKEGFFCEAEEKEKEARISEEGED